MRMKIIFAAAVVMLAGIAQPALADSWRDFGGGFIQTQLQQPRQDRVQRPPQPDFRRPEQPPERGPRGDGRMTDEERRGLHRDLDRANREIYKGQQR
jgi:hypothetical protein